MDLNDQFVHACENGDYKTVHRILEENPKFSIDVTNQLGRSAMQLAIEKEHLEVKEIFYSFWIINFHGLGRDFTLE